MPRAARVPALVALVAASSAFTYLIPGAGASPQRCHTNGRGDGCPTTRSTTRTTASRRDRPCGTRTSQPAVYGHVIWIFMENKSYGQIIGSKSARYINELASKCGLAKKYSAITHPSLPNYIAATSGDYWGIADDNAPASHPLAVDSIYSQLKAINKSWRDYEESAPSPCPSASNGLYAVKHDPAPYYAGVGSDCANWDVPMGTTSSGNFISDLTGNSLPDFAFVTPNQCNNMHDCSIPTGDAWLSKWVPLILASPAYQAGTTALFITWDEDDSSESNRVATLVVSPYTRAGTISKTAFNHYSLLRTTEEMLGLSTFLAHAGDPGTTSMRMAFGL